AAEHAGRLAMTTPILETAGWTLIHFLWQGCALAAVAATLLRLAERRSANARYLIACAALVVMVATPAVTARLLWDAGIEAARLKPVLSELALRQAQSERVEGRRSPETDAFAKVVQSSGSTRSRVPVRTSDSGPSLFSALDKQRIVTGFAFAWMLGVSLLLARMAGG